MARPFCRQGIGEQIPVQTRAREDQEEWEAKVTKRPQVNRPLAHLRSLSALIGRSESPGISHGEEVLQVPRTVDSLILSVLKGSQNVIEAIVSVKAERSSSVYS